MLNDAARTQIESSLGYLKSKVWGLFQERLDNVHIFGSYDRNTIIPVGDNMDVDVMILFKRNEWKPETYLSQIKALCEKYYSNSFVYRDHPTITIELNHIKIELVPAYLNGSKLMIPGRRTDETPWIPTSPASFKAELLEKNKNNHELITPLIRLYKYWNFHQGNPFSSFNLEQFIIDKTYYFFLSTPTLSRYYYEVAIGLESIAKTEKQKNAIKLLIEQNTKIKKIEKNELNGDLETELISLIPVLTST